MTDTEHERFEKWAAENTDLNIERSLIDADGYISFEAAKEAVSRPHAVGLSAYRRLSKAIAAFEASHEK